MIVNLRDAIMESNRLCEESDFSAGEIYSDEDGNLKQDLKIPMEYASKKVMDLPTGIGLGVLHAMERAYPDEYTEDLWDFICDVSPKSLNDTHNLGIIFESLEEETAE